MNPPRRLHTDMRCTESSPYITPMQHARNVFFMYTGLSLSPPCTWQQTVLSASASSHRRRVSMEAITSHQGIITVAFSTRGSNTCGGMARKPCLITSRRLGDVHILTHSCSCSWDASAGSILKADGKEKSMQEGTGKEADRRVDCELCRSASVQRKPKPRMRPECACRCGCTRRPRRRIECPICHHHVGPGCHPEPCWNPEAQCCHVCAREKPGGQLKQIGVGDCI